MRLEAYTVRNLEYYPDCGLTGRRKILSPVKEVTAENVRNVLEKALAVHSINAGEINYLYNYYKGKQDIRGKVKYARENINNKVTVNRANEIVTFKTAYLLNAPIQYISSGGSDKVSKNVNRLNSFMHSKDKESKDKEVVDWVHICGVAERLCLPDATLEKNGAPFGIYTIDPRHAFVIYNSGIGNKPIAGVILQVDEDDRQFATVYTPYKCFTVNGDTVTEELNRIGLIPLVEYVNNGARLGAFEIVLSILNNINVLESNAIDAVQEFVNGFDVFQDCDLEDGEYGKLSLGGQALFIKSNGMTPSKVYRIASELNQSGVQTRVDDLTDTYLTICGMPNRNGGTSTSDTGTAVIYRDGWSEAESRANDSEKMFKRSEREFLRIALTICDAHQESKLGLKLSDLKVDFLRKNLSNVQSKAQVLCELLGNDYIHPKDAYIAASLFRDNEESYRRGMEWHEKQEAATESRLQEELINARQSVAENRPSNRRTERNSSTDVQEGEEEDSES